MAAKSERALAKKRAYMKAWQHRNEKRIQAQRREHYQAHTEEFLARRRKYRTELRLEVLVHYSQSPPSCSCCNEKHLEFLAIDHINGGGNQHLKKLGMRGSRFYSWLRRNHYPHEYRVLCHNCNSSYGAYGYCPHTVHK